MFQNGKEFPPIKEVKVGERKRESLRASSLDPPLTRTYISQDLFLMTYGIIFSEYNPLTVIQATSKNLPIPPLHSVAIEHVLV